MVRIRRMAMRVRRPGVPVSVTVPAVNGRIVRVIMMSVVVAVSVLVF